MSALLNPAADDIELVAASYLFDAEWYVGEYPDVAKLDINPAEHYVMLGAALGRSPSKYFDTTGYMETYPEAEGQNPLIH